MNTNFPVIDQYDTNLSNVILTSFPTVSTQYKRQARSISRKQRKVQTYRGAYQHSLGLFSIDSVQNHQSCNLICDYAHF